MVIIMKIGFKMTDDDPTDANDNIYEVVNRILNKHRIYQ